MSEIINNREKRQEVLKDIIKKRHEGSTVDEVTSDIAPIQAITGEKRLVD